MAKPMVYLSGPMAGLTFSEASCWRESVTGALNDVGIVCLSPLRGKEFLLTTGSKIRKVKTNYPGFSPRRLLGRDYMDTVRSDLVLVNLLGAKEISIGTVLEIGWAFANRIPIVLAMEEGNVHEHCLLNESSDFKTDDLPSAIELVKDILLP